MGAMRRAQIRAFALAALGTFFVSKLVGSEAPPGSTAPLAKKLRAERTSRFDLEVSGDLEGVPLGATWYLTREDLLTLPQVGFMVSDDPNLPGPTRLSGVPLENLVRDVGAPAGDMVVAISKDQYRANYPRDYLAEHHPLLVLEIGGLPPSGWPKDSGFDLGPYMISHAKFTPAVDARAHVDEAQIPWGVVRVEFRDERLVFAAIRPSGTFANSRSVEAGYHIARQNCFHCHDAGDEGGKKSGVSWAALSAIATASPDFFAAYVRNPKLKSPRSQMPANPQYDDLALDALSAYFRSFSKAQSP